MGELQQAIIVERLPTDRQLQSFWLLMAVCCSWDIVGGFSSYVFGGVANDPHPLLHPLICVIEFD